MKLSMKSSLLSSSFMQTTLIPFIFGVIASSCSIYMLREIRSTHTNSSSSTTSTTTSTTTTSSSSTTTSSSSATSSNESSTRLIKDNDNKINNTIIEHDIPLYIKEEIFSRIQSFFGDDNFDKIKKSFVIVVGLGGVGSHAAHMLVRSGVGNLRLIDFDQVTVSSLNRHAVASMEDVGISKVESMKRKLLKIVPWCNIEAISEMFRGCDASKLLNGQPDFVIDAIDDVNTKAELIAYCVHNKINVLTSMGAGGKADPTRLRIAQLSECVHDPLASKIKWKLKKHGVQADDVMSIFSLEMPIVDLQPLDDEQKNSPQDFGAVDYLRLRIMPVLGTSPSIFGQAMASYILCSLANKLYVPEVCERMSKNLKHKLRQTLKNYEFRRGYSHEDLDIDDDDIEFIVQQVWHSRCAITGRKFGGHAQLILVRWNEKELPSPSNLVLLMQPYADAMVKGDMSFLKDDALNRINMRLLWAKAVSKGFWESSSNISNNENKTFIESKKDNNRIYTCLALGIGVGAGVGYLIGKIK